MRDSASPDLYRPPNPVGRPSVWVDAIQAVAIVGSIAIAWFAVVQPATRQVARTLEARGAAIVAFEALARRVEAVQDLEPRYRDRELASVLSMLRELRELWIDAGVSDQLRPIVEMRPIGPVLTLADIGPPTEPPR